MGLKSFLQAQGFIANDDNDTAPDHSIVSSTPPPLPMAAVVFPSQDKTSYTDTQTPAFVQSMPAENHEIDPAFIKFYEDELVKANLPGPDYFEFRQQMNTMSRKMAGKGVSDDLILQTVLASFEAQNIPAAKLSEAARFYKNALNEKKDSFLKGAAAEKDNQLQKRTAALQAHEAHIESMNKQMQELQRQMQLLTQHLAEEKSQIEIDKTMGKEGIEKIARAEQQIALAYSFMCASIDKDLALLQSS